MIRIALGNEISDFLENENLTLEDFSILTGITLWHLSRIKNGKIDVGIKHLEKLAHGMGISFDELARRVQRRLDLLESKPPASEFLVSTELLKTDGVLMFNGGLINPAILKNYQKRFFREGREHNVQRILIDSLRVDLSERERYHAARSGGAMGKHLGYAPHTAMLTQIEADRMGLEIASDNDIPTKAFPPKRRREALRWLSFAR